MVIGFHRLAIVVVLPPVSCTCCRPLSVVVLPPVSCTVFNVYQGHHWGLWNFVFVNCCLHRLFPFFLFIWFDMQWDSSVCSYRCPKRFQYLPFLRYFSLFLVAHVISPLVWQDRGWPCELGAGPVLDQFVVDPVVACWWV